MSLRVALVTEVFLPAVDGVVTRLTHTLEQQQARGHEVMVVAPTGGPATYAGATVVGMPALRMPLYPDGDGYPEKRVSLPHPELGRALRAFQPDLIHTVNPVLLGVGAVYIARRENIPLVASYHAHLPAYARMYGLGALESVGWRYVRTLHNRADLNLCTSQATLSTLRMRGVRRLALWPHGVEHERPAPDAVAAWRRRLTQGAPERSLLLYVGRLAKEKQIDRLRPLIARLDGATLAIVGDGPARSELEHEFKGTSTTFAGMLSGEDLAAAYAASDLFVFPSESETLGLVIREAQAAGLPVVTSATAVGRELVRDGVDGALYEPGDAEALISKTAALLDDPLLRAQMGDQGRSAVLGVTWETATDVLEEHYAAAIEAHRARSGRHFTRSS